MLPLTTDESGDLTPSERDGKEARVGVVEKRFVRYRGDRCWHRHPLGNSTNTVDFIPCPSLMNVRVPWFGKYLGLIKFDFLPHMLCTRSGGRHLRQFPLFCLPLRLP